MVATHSATGRGSEALLTVAVRSIAAASGATLEELVHQRALRHYGEGIRQYLAIRLGSTARGRRAWQRVQSMAAEVPLEAAPGARARLYRLAREAAEREGPGAPGPELPWRAPRQEMATDALERLRCGLPESDAELLELRHARELDPEEIAFVVHRPVEHVLGELGEAAARAADLVRDTDLPLRQLLLEAFALRPEERPVKAEHAEPLALPRGAVVAGRYTILERVGTGAFGDVYRARDTEVPGHVVALKLLHQPARTVEARAEALRELHVIASVFHPSVVQFKDHGWHEGRLWFVMPWYEGETLEERIRRRPLSRTEARRIFEPLAQALAAIHAAGIRHQDIKPDNIFLARIPGFGGRNGGEQVLPVLLDLGVAAKEAEMLVAGTPTYFAPEVAAQFAQVDPRPAVGPKSDVFALALALRNALEPETEPDVPAGAIQSFIQERARTVPPMPIAQELRFLEPSLRRWMSLDPDDRPTAAELAYELTVLTKPEARRRRVVSMVRWVAPAVVALLAVFGAVVFGLHTRAERQELRAERARRAEAGLREDLHASKAVRRTLEQRMREAHQDYVQSKMSRDQLASKLAQVQETQRQLGDQLHDARVRRERLQGELAAKERQLDDSQAALASTRNDLRSAQADAEKAKTRAARLNDQLAGLHRDLAAADDRITTLQGQLDATEGRLAAEQAKSHRLERALDAASAARARAEAALTRAQHPAAPDDATSDDSQGPDDPAPADDAPTGTPGPIS